MVASLAGAVGLTAASAAFAAANHRFTAAAQRLDGRTHQALLDLYSLDAELAQARSRVAALEAASGRLQRERAALRQELAADRTTLTVSQHDLGLHLRGLYEGGTVDPLAVMLGATSVQDAVSRLDALTSVAQQSRYVVAATTAARARLSSARTALAREQRRLAAALGSARAAQAALERTRTVRLASIARLRARRRPTRVDALVKQAKQIERKSRTLQPPATSSGGDGSIAPQPASGGRRLAVSATCYDLSGRTATGMPVGWGVVAVDPNVIPLGSKLYVPGYGDGVAADVGGGISGAVIDLWMPYAKCAAWGRHSITITVY